jgi:hypothetical protein
MVERGAGDIDDARIQLFTSVAKSRNGVQAMHVGQKADGGKFAKQR